MDKLYISQLTLKIGKVSGLEALHNWLIFLTIPQPGLSLPDQS